MSNITVREWIDKFNHGKFDNEDFKTQCAAGWYNWFCSTKSLAKKLKKMGNIIKDIKIVLDNQRKQMRSKYLWKEVLSQWRIHPKNFVFSKKPSHWGGFFEQKKS